jgi:hypothetical protein
VPSPKVLSPKEPSTRKPRRSCRESGLAARSWQPRHLFHTFSSSHSQPRTPSYALVRPRTPSYALVRRRVHPELGGCGAPARREPIACHGGRESWSGSWIRGRDGEESDPVGRPTGRLLQRRLRRQEGGCLFGAAVLAAASAALESPRVGNACTSHACHRPYARTADSALPSDVPSPGTPRMTAHSHGNQRDDQSKRASIGRCVDLTARTRTTT